MRGAFGGPRHAPRAILTPPIPRRAPVISSAPEARDAGLHSAAVPFHEDFGARGPMAVASVPKTEDRLVVEADAAGAWRDWQRRSM